MTCAAEIARLIGSAETQSRPPAVRLDHGTPYVVLWATYIARARNPSRPRSTATGVRATIGWPKRFAYIRWTTARWLTGSAHARAWRRRFPAPRSGDPAA